MGNNARKTVEEGWTWKIQAENYRKMFNDIFEKELICHIISVHNVTMSGMHTKTSGFS
jgi:hypothetical protein